MHTDEAAVSDLFRPSKRRQFYRKRTETDDENLAPASPLAQSVSPAPAAPAPSMKEPEYAAPSSIHSNDGPPFSVADILRQRKAVQRKKGGVEFTSSASSSSAPPQVSSALITKEEAEDGIPTDIKSVISRFAPQTGQVSEETDKHM